MNSDIICITETHLHVDNVIHISGYRWFSFNRSDIHVNASKPSGGVGILVQNWLTDHVIAILGIEFKNHNSDLATRTF